MANRTFYMGEDMETNANVEKMGNHRQRKAVAAIMKRRPNDIKEKFAATHRAFDEMVKDNMAEKVIDNFVATLAASPLKTRLRFCYGLIFNR